MRQSYYFSLFLYLILTCCNQNSRKDNSISNENKGDSSQNGIHKASDTLPYTLSRNDSPIAMYRDFGVNDLRLFDATSIEKHFGRQIRIVDTDTKKLLDQWHEFEGFQVINYDSTQLLTLQVCYGGGKNEFCNFRIEKLEASYKFYFEPVKDTCKEFISTKGIKIGMLDTDLLDVLGKPHSKRSKSSYKIVSYDEDGGLYFGDYYFVKHKLIKFQFGDTNP